jgi:hypothetical protein
MGRKFDDQKALSYKSPPEVRDAANWEAERISEKYEIRIPDERGFTKPATAAYFVNWVLCHFFALPEPERDRIALEGREVFDARMASDRSIRFPLDPLEDSDSEGAPAPPEASIEPGKAGGIRTRNRKGRKGDRKAVGPDDPVVANHVPALVK